MIYKYVIKYVTSFTYCSLRKEYLCGYRFINDVITYLITNLNVERAMRARAHEFTLVLWWYSSVAGKMQVTAKIYGLPATGSSHHSFLMVIEATELKGSASRPYLPTCIVSSFFSFLCLKEKTFTFSR